MAKKQSLKERLQQRREELKTKSSQGSIIFLKADTETRVRILFMGEEEEFIKEVTQFYLGGDIKGVISPVSIGEPCAINEAYQELRNSDDDDEKELALKFPPRSRYLAYVAVYKDGRGKELDELNSGKFILLTGGLYQDILDHYLDEDEWGDMTDPINGYDLKLKRVGSGKMDTEYSVTPCKNTPAPKQYRDMVFNIDEELKRVIPSYEETQTMINTFLGINSGDDDEEDLPKETPLKSAKKKKKPTTKKKKTTTKKKKTTKGSK